MGPQFPCFNRRPGNESDQVGRYDERFVTKLLNNYRSHPAIIKVSACIWGETLSVSHILKGPNFLWVKTALPNTAHA